jgi:hypothetical protein
MNYKEYWAGYKNFVVQPRQTIKLVEIPLTQVRERRLNVEKRLEQF